MSRPFAVRWAEYVWHSDAATSVSAGSASVALVASGRRKVLPAVRGARRVPALDDNYIWLIKDEVTGKAAVVDPAEDAPVEEAMKVRCSIC